MQSGRQSEQAPRCIGLQPGRMGLQRATPMVAGAASAHYWQRTYPVDRPTSAVIGWRRSTCRWRRGRRRAALSVSAALIDTWMGLVSPSMGLGCSATAASSGVTASVQGSSRPRPPVTTSSMLAPPAAYYALTTHYSLHDVLLTYHLPLTTYHLPLTTYHLPLTTYHLLPRYACPACSAYEASTMKRSRPSVTLEAGKEAGLCGTPDCTLPDYHQASRE